MHCPVHVQTRNFEEWFVIVWNEAFPSITLQPAPLIVSSSAIMQPFSSGVMILDLAVLIRQPSVVKRECGTGDSYALLQV